MAQDPHSTSEGETAPPSFIPTNSRKNGTGSSDTSSQPPSYTPSGETGKPTMTPSPDQTAVGGSPGGTREPRRAGGSKHVAPSSSYVDPTPSAPITSGAGSSPAPTPRTVESSGSGGSINPSQHDSFLGKGNEKRKFLSINSSGSGTGSGKNDGSTTAKKKRRPAKIILTALIAIMAVLALLVVFLFSWVNSQLTHFDGLSTRASGSSQTWLITGSDVRDGTEGTGAPDSVVGERTDSILVLVKPSSGPSALISLPRDSYVTVDGKDMKLNAVSETFGWPKFSEAVEEITGLKVDHLVRIGFGGVKNVVDALGGINLCYDRTVNDPYSGLNWTAGCHDVNGDVALAYSRMRYADPDGDFGRTKRQRNVIQSIAKKASSTDTLFNFGKMQKVSKAALSSIKVDENANTFSLLQMALAFKSATGEGGISGSVYYTNPGYYPKSRIGSTVLLASEKNLILFSDIAAGKHKPGIVGGYSQ